MSKQLTFCATDSDKEMIVHILNGIFGQMVDVPQEKDDSFIFDGNTDKQMLWLAEESRLEDIVYKMHEYYDGSKAEVLDYRNSPVMEYSPSSNRPDGGIFEGRFYCCSNDVAFTKKVSKFLTKLKKEFLFVKKYQIYISRNIDLNTTPLGLVGAEFEITGDDLT